MLILECLKNMTIKDINTMGSIYLINHNGRAIGRADYTRYKALPWYKKVICWFSWRYKRKFVDIKGLPIEDFFKGIPIDGK